MTKRNKKVLMLTGNTIFVKKLEYWGSPTIMSIGRDAVENYRNRMVRVMERWYHENKELYKLIK